MRRTRKEYCERELSHIKEKYNIRVTHYGNVYQDTESYYSIDQFITLCGHCLSEAKWLDDNFGGHTLTLDQIKDKATKDDWGRIVSLKHDIQELVDRYMDHRCTTMNDESGILPWGHKGRAEEFIEPLNDILKQCRWRIQRKDKLNLEYMVSSIECLLEDCISRKEYYNKMYNIVNEEACDV